MAILSINIQTRGSDSDRIPKKVEVIDSTMQHVQSVWIEGAQQNIQLSPGLYAVILELASGKRLEKVAQVNSDADTSEVRFDLSKITPHESHEWAYLSKKPVETKRLLVEKRYRGAWVRFWKKNSDGRWEITNSPIQNQSSWDRDGVSYNLEVSRAQHFMQVGGPKIPWRLVALPPAEELMCLIQPGAGPSYVHPLKISVTSNSWKAETLLTYLQKDSYKEARELVNNAEELLYGKVSNPSAAAIGAYYLIKTRQLDRLHNWVENLRNWMEWMPDGAVLRAWQLILEGRSSKQLSPDQLEEIRTNLLLAWERGIPLYTIGLKLLREGLELINAMMPEDNLIMKNLAKVKQYIAAADLQSSTTTFNGIKPEKPDAMSRTGTPETKHLAYLYDIPRSAVRKALNTPKIHITENFLSKGMNNNVGNIIPGPKGDFSERSFDSSPSKRSKKSTKALIDEYKESMLNSDKPNDEVLKWRTGRFDT